MTHPPAVEQVPGTTLTLSDPGSFAGLVQRTVLPGGLRVITEHLPADPTVTFGIVVAHGSRDDPAHLAGAAHFLEHMLFQGTASRSWKQINAELDAVGARHNAYTDREHTAYWATALAEDLPVTVDVIADLLAHATLPAPKVETERTVILEEIAMRHDQAQVRVEDALPPKLFGVGSALARSVGGTPAILARMGRKELADHYRTHYSPPNLIVVAAGRVDHTWLVDQIRTVFSDQLRQVARPSPPRTATMKVASFSGTHHEMREAEQMVIGLGVQGLARTDHRLPALQVLNAMLANAPSSRLYQQVREERGLAYSVRSSHDAWSDTGMWLLKVGCNPAKAGEALRVCREELATIAEHGLTSDEVARARGQVVGKLGLRTTDGMERFEALAEQELYGISYSSLDRERERLLAVGEEQVREVAGAVLSWPPTVLMVGPKTP